MASQNPPKRATAYTYSVSLVSQADTKLFQTSVTLAAGDVTVSKDGAGFNNVTNLPVEIGTSGVIVGTLTATEMTADRVVVRFRDVADAQWCDTLVVLDTVTTNQFDDLATVAGILAAVIEGTKTLQAGLVDIWAATVGETLANDADNPTSIAYDGPDGTVQITHTLTGTTRAVS